MENSSTPRKLVPLVLRVAPGLANLLEYRRKWLRHDAVVGVSVAAVALPTAIAYAQLIGFDPVAGLYAAILPLVGLCGAWHLAPPYRKSGRCHLRHGRRNFDAADGAPTEFASVALGGAGSFHGDLLHPGRFPAAGFLWRIFSLQANSRGILTPLAIHIFLGQIGKVFGFGMESHGIFPFAPGVSSKTAADPLGNARRGRADNWSDAGGQAVAAALARALAGGGLRCGARSQHGPGWKGGRGGGRGAGGIAAAAVAGIRR